MASNNKVIIKDEDRKEATPVSDFKDYILTELDQGGEIRKNEIFKHVKEKHPFNHYDNMYNQLKSAGTPIHKVGDNNFSWALVHLQKENKIKKIEKTIDKEKVKFYYKA